MEPAPTQTAHPWRATFRTAVAVGIPAFVGLALILPAVLTELVNGPIGEYLPAGFVAWLLGFAGLITAAAAGITRILAIPGVIEWCRKYLSILAPDGNGKRRAEP